MALANFNVVLAGENFPVTTLNLADFEFRHRKLQETLRLPMILQAGSDTVRLQVLPERFEVGIVRPDQVDVQLQGLVEMTESFYDYVGRKAITGVGHNFSYVLNESSARSQQMLNSLVNLDRVSGVLQSNTPILTNQQYFFTRGSETQARVLLGVNEVSDLVLDFNFHFDLRDPSNDYTAAYAVGKIRESLSISEEMTVAFKRSFEGVAA